MKLTLLSLCVLGAMVHAQVPSSAPAEKSLPPTRLLLDAKQQAALGVQVAPVQASGKGQVLVSATVVTPPGKAFTVSAPYAGQISRLMVGVGDAVKSGAPLAQFTSPMLGDARRLLNEASIDYKTASAAAQRDQAMLDEGIIPAVRLQLSRAKQEAALSLLKSREAELAVSGLRFDGASGGYATGVMNAPLSGVVLEAFAAVGQRVEAGAVLFKLADTSQLQLELQLSNDKAAQLQAGDEVSIATRDAKAKILAVSRAVDASQSARARAVVTQRGNLQVGEFVAVTVHAKSKPLTAGQSQWLVPSRAITQWRGKPWLFVVHPQGFDAQAVNVISATDDVSLVEAAWPAGTQVATTGIASLRALLQKDE
ncbi:efflux RND transporter periplasmic adaptor subunit [Limnohabitans sp. B9-3]|uniref:efflux RND transporter periplasmic adaptor subunit n=1 Tax=Limnohabitans sp. B9-3 TaxID=1100707 RepID=UPI001E32D473|nr:efflux RND transporter periplasmic adaptor subunit [Limnohabitans sp. B9-3]